MRIKVFLLSFIMIIITNFVFGEEIRDYKTCFGVYTLNEKNDAYRFVLRKFIMNDSEYYLTVDPHNLNTYAERSNPLTKIQSETLQGLCDKYGSTNYIIALIFSKKLSRPIQNAGFTHFQNIKNGLILTADLCPSKLPIDKKLFLDLLDKYLTIQKPVPVALCLTGLWMETHSEDIEWLKSLEAKSQLSITWVNHSYNHRYKNDIPLNCNFLLMQDTNIEAEVLETEMKMLKAGIVPSVFFRFPGLVSNQELFNKITGFGLIPIGSNAWLGKDQWPKKGSIVLVHANGNEPAGIARFNEFLQREKKNISGKHWTLFNLKESVAGTFDNNN